VCDYRIASVDITSLVATIQRVEKSRLGYKFAEPATLDDVVVSLFLFVAYNVLERHPRAYLYLDEAFSLLEIVDTAEVSQRRLIEQVLVNTEKATAAIYARPGRNRRGMVPTNPLEVMPVSSSFDGKMSEHEELALTLLNKLTTIYAASDLAMLAEDSSLSSALNALRNMPSQQRQYCRIQAADAALSQQWQLFTKLVTNLGSRALSAGIATEKAEKLGVAAMSWICSLAGGELRIVGLGKIAGMLQAIRVVSNDNGCDAVVNGLVGALMREDHEKMFAPAVARVVTASMAPSSALRGACLGLRLPEPAIIQGASVSDTNKPLPAEWDNNDFASGDPSYIHPSDLVSDIAEVTDGVDWVNDLLIEDEEY
jgi:hypothetical protein